MVDIQWAPDKLFELSGMTTEAYAWLRKLPGYTLKIPSFRPTSRNLKDYMPDLPVSENIEWIPDKFFELSGMTAVICAAGV